ncbi:transposase [Stenotrophomonas maltophilia]|nr:transposase [Stenotrophomonas maltophilia]MCU1061271.1 transposase [Stenotrophomonas maltophilia]MCU1165499.1 transposase [Stenotrophomonas maltophilia]
MTEVFMGNSKQYTDEFRAEAVKQVIERGFTVVDVASRIGIPKHTLYGWVQAAKKTVRAPGTIAVLSDSAEIRRLKAELRRVTEERDILKKAAVSSTRQCNMINSCTDRSERYGKDGAARHVSSPEARSMATMEGRPVAQRHCPLL